MLFSSFIFLCFFPIVVLGFWLIPGKWKKFWLLVTSMVFIMSASVYAVIILLLVAAFSFAFGLLLEYNAKKGKNNLFLLWSGILGCLLPLGWNFLLYFTGDRLSDRCLQTGRKSRVESASLYFIFVLFSKVHFRTADGNERLSGTGKGAVFLEI